jgi:ribosome maturation factor RimP
LELVTRITDMISPSLEGLGYDVVRVQYNSGKHAVLQIMADRSDGAPIRVEDCELISNTVSALLDVDDPIAAAYSLEVSSPGIDRPLTRLSDFERWAGHKAKVELKVPTEAGRKRFSGVVRGAHGDRIRIELDGGELAELPFADIHAAKLELTDDLLKQAMKAEGVQS